MQNGCGHISIPIRVFLGQGSWVGIECIEPARLEKPVAGRKVLVNSLVRALISSAVLAVLLYTIGDIGLCIQMLNCRAQV